MSIQISEPPTKLSQIAYQRFKEALFSRKIQVGSTVSQGELADLLEVQTGALREAMQILEKEGYLNILPRSGIQIVKPDMGFLKNCFQMRRVLEVEAVARFAERVRLKELVDWRQRHERVIKLSRSGEGELALIAELTELDLAFHRHMIAGLRNPIMSAAHNHAMDQIGLIRLDNMYMLSAMAVTQTMQEHLAVIAALEAQDAKGAVEGMETHLARAMHRAMGL